MPTGKIKTTHWTPVRPRGEQAILDQIAAGTVRYAPPRDLLTGAPLLPPASAQTMAGGWYPTAWPAGGTAERGSLPRCHLPHYVSRALPAANTTPDTPTDDDSEMSA